MTFTEARALVKYTKPDASYRRIVGLMVKPSGPICDCPPGAVCICKEAAPV